MRKAFDWKRSLEAFVGSGSRTPELYSVSPGWLEHCFIYEKCIACGELPLATLNKWTKINEIWVRKLYDSLSAYPYLGLSLKISDFRHVCNFMLRRLS
jgi:hypothetical protein